MDILPSFTESIRTTVAIPEDGKCLELSGFTLSEHLQRIATRYNDPAYTDAKKQLKYKLKVDLRTPAELGNNSTRIGINTILFALERRLINQQKFPYIAEADENTSPYPFPPRKLISWMKLENISPHFESEIDALCLSLFVSLEKADWKETQRKYQNSSKCPGLSFFARNTGFMANKNQRDLVKKQQTLDKYLKALLLEHRSSLEACKSEVEATITSLEVYLRGLKIWLDCVPLPERYAQRSLQSDQGDETVEHVRRKQLVKDCQNIYEKLTGKTPSFTQVRTSKNSIIRSEFGDLCRLLANKLGDKTFANSTARMIHHEQKNKERPWLVDHIANCIRKNPSDPEKCFHDIVVFLQESSQAIPPEGELQKQIYEVARGLDQYANLRKSLGRN